MNKCVNWLFGVGASVACGLDWVVPESWKNIDREILINKIKSELTDRMANVLPSVYIDLLLVLAEQTRAGWQHRFITTNWDCLLEKAINNQNWTALPPWLNDDWVYHLNGTIEILSDNQHRSPFLLETDSRNQRHLSVEANEAYNKIIWDRLFVVIGMSFECSIDKGFLEALHKVEDEILIGESHWIIINPDQIALEKVASDIMQTLPRCSVDKVTNTFENWIKSGMHELKTKDVLGT